MLNPYGTPVIASDNWPKQKPVYGTFTSRAHPFIEWVSKYLDFDPNTYFENVVLSYTWNDPIMTGGKLYMSMYQFDALKRQLHQEDLMREMTELTNPYRGIF